MRIAIGSGRNKFEQINSMFFNLIREDVNEI